MHSCVRWTQLARQTCRRALTWRAGRLCCAVWFALVSMGLPGSLSLLSGQSCARSPGAQCRCSLAKRMSGTCCCGRHERQPQVARACCAATTADPQSAQPRAAGCCSSTSKAQQVMVKSPSKVELSIGRCDCGSESPERVSLVQEPRLPVVIADVLLPESNSGFVALPVRRVESACLLPPVPPPKVALS